MLTMETLTAEIQARVRTLLAEGVVDLFIGYKAGSNPLRVAPHVVRTGAESEKLVWNSACTNNLVVALQKHSSQNGQDRQKIGILVKGCDARSLIELLKLHQVRRENLYILGVPCHGMLDLRKVTAAHTSHDPAAIVSVAEQGEHIWLYTKTGDAQVCDRNELLAEKCNTCASPEPLLYDELIGYETPPRREAADPFAAVEELERLDVQERFAFWNELLSACTLCYACQTVCPLCFCKQCAVTLPRSDPKRQERSYASVLAFHLGRAYHMAGRCTGCYECERVCPAHIPLSLIFRKVEKDSLELFNYTAGIDVNDVIPLSSFAEDDHALEAGGKRI